MVFDLINFVSNSIQKPDSISCSDIRGWKMGIVGYTNRYKLSHIAGIEALVNLENLTPRIPPILVTNCSISSGFPRTMMVSRQ
jgi:hypothetical protein